MEELALEALMTYKEPQMRNLLLVSSSMHWTGYLDHCADEVVQTFSSVNKITFIPYALKGWDRYEELACKRFLQLGLRLESIHKASDPVAVIQESEAVFVGGGNTFVLLKALHEKQIFERLRERVAAGMPYMGTSAGANIAGQTIGTTNDMPIAFPPSLVGLAAVPFNINPHYYDFPEDWGQKGETRDQRIAEFIEYNKIPVVALYEGAYLRITSEASTVLGEGGARVFGWGSESVRLPIDARIDDLLRGPSP